MTSFLTHIFQNLVPLAFFVSLPPVEFPTRTISFIPVGQAVSDELRDQSRTISFSVVSELTFRCQIRFFASDFK